MTEEPIQKNGSSRTKGRASWVLFAASSALWRIGIAVAWRRYKRMTCL